MEARIWNISISQKERNAYFSNLKKYRISNALDYSSNRLKKLVVNYLDGVTALGISKSSMIK